MSDDDYVVAVKQSARKVSPAAGRWVRLQGPNRAFDSKALAREWAREASTQGHTVWVQDAAPADPDPVDGYVVAGRRAAPRRHADPGEQASIAGSEE